jgi:hypothetical protein
MPHGAKVRPPPLCVHALGSFKPIRAHICALGSHLCPLGLFYAPLGFKCMPPFKRTCPSYVSALGSYMFLGGSFMPLGTLLCPLWLKCAPPLGVRAPLRPARFSSPKACTPPRRVRPPPPSHPHVPLFSRAYPSSAVCASP